MLPYHITITENETGEKYLEMDACVIIGACGDDEQATMLVSCDCNGQQLLGTILTAFRALENTIEQLDPIEKQALEISLKVGNKNEQ